MDPQIEAVFGLPDYVVHAFRSSVDEQAKRGDYFGIHPHPIRRSDDGGRGVHDLADPDWAAQCLRASADAFANVFGSPARRHRYAAAFISGEIVDEADLVEVQLRRMTLPALL